MASQSAPNPYGHLPGSAPPAPVATPTTPLSSHSSLTSGSEPARNHYYADYQQIGGGGGAPGAAGDKPPLGHTSASLASYDAAHQVGMSSDSELTTSSTAARHHHRPYSSQSRVYHAHPVPRSATHHAQQAAAGAAGPARLSHYSNSVANVQTLCSPAGAHDDSPISPAPLQQQLEFRLKQQSASAGRQLPQRPFKHSMSIDQQSPMSSPGSSGHHFAHSPAHLNYMSDPIASHYYPQKQQQQQHKNYQAVQCFDQFKRLEMELVESKAAKMALYEANEAAKGADLPPVGSLRSASSAGRHLPAVAGVTSLSLEHQRQQQLQHQHPFHQQAILQSSPDPYVGHSFLQQQQHQHMTGSADWLPSLGAGNQQQISLGRASGQFKQTMSIDHYPASRQHLHYSPARQYQSPADVGGVCAFGGAAPPPQPLSNQQHHQIGAHGELAGANQHQQPAYYANEPLSVGYRQQQPQQQRYPSQQNIDNFAHEQPNEHHRHFEHAATMDRPASRGSTTHQQQFAASSRHTLQHQPSSSSNNSNLSASLLSAGQLEPAPQDGASAAAAAADHHYKSQPSGQTCGYQSQHHYQQSPSQQPVESGGKQERRAHTSAAGGLSSGAELSGSQGVLSESGGELSVSQTSHTGQHNRRNLMRAGSPSLGFDSGAHHSHHQHHHRPHHSTSSAGQPSSSARQDTADLRSESSTGLPYGSGANSTLTKKSNSATQLSMTGTKKRLGFRKKQVTSFSVHRSEEVAPAEARHLVKQGSSVSEGDSSMSGDSSSRSWSNSNFKQQTSEELASMSFIDGLGKGQMISRQGLASPYLGDIQLSLCDRRGNLEIEVIRARNLQAKTNKILPLTYVKLYLVKNRKCLGKAKTALSSKRTLNPLFQQQLTFHEDYHGCILQSIVWGNFGKMDKKNFMGIAQISIDDLELGDTVISWYKLFLPSSLQTLPSKSLRHTLLSNSTESFTNATNP